MTKSFKEGIKNVSRLCIIIAFTIALLITGRIIIIPLAISFLAAMVLNPIVIKLEAIKINRVVAILLTMLAFLLLVLAFFIASSYQISSLIEELPNLQQRTWDKFGGIITTAEEYTGYALADRKQWLGANGENVQAVLTDFLSITSTVLTGVAQVPIYVFLFLLYKDKFYQFFTKIYQGSKKMSAQYIEEVRNVVQGYVFGIFLVICILAILNTLGLYLLGIEFAIFFGVFSAVLTVVPYIGNIIGGLLPCLFALITKDSAWYAVGVIAVYGVVQFLEGNFITPNVMGSKVSINPLIALLALIVGGKILGLAGLIIAIPLVGILKVAISHSESLKPLVILMEENNN